MTKPIRLLALDGDWLVHRAFYAMGGGKATEEDMPRIVAMTLSKCVHWCLTLTVQQEATHLIFALDGGRSFRKDVYPAYKSNRGTYVYQGEVVQGERLCELLNSGIQLRREPTGVDAVLNQLPERLTDWGVFVMRVPRYEADDVLASAATLAKRLGNSGQRIKAILGTADKDTLQSLSDYAEQTYPHHIKTEPDVVVRFREMGTRLVKYVHADATNWTPNQFLDYQILIGDSTDFIPEVLSKAKARKVINEHGSLHAYFKTRDGRTFFDLHSEELRRNVQLVRMNRDLMRDWSDEDLDATRLRIKPKDPAQVTRMLAKAYDAYRTYQRAASSNTLL